MDYGYGDVRTLIVVNGLQMWEANAVAGVPTSRE